MVIAGLRSLLVRWRAERFGSQSHFVLEMLQARKCNATPYFFIHQILSQTGLLETMVFLSQLAAPAFP